MNQRRAEWILYSLNSIRLRKDKKVKLAAMHLDVKGLFNGLRKPRK